MNQPHARPRDSAILVCSRTRNHTRPTPSATNRGGLNLPADLPTEARIVSAPDQAQPPSAVRPVRRGRGGTGLRIERVRARQRGEGAATPRGQGHRAFTGPLFPDARTPGVVAQVLVVRRGLLRSWGVRGMASP
jgi:hypothetical protein